MSVARGGFGPNQAIKLNMMPMPASSDIEVSFMVSMRQLMSVHHNALALDIARRAQEALTAHLVAYLDSVEFDAEVKSAVRDELKTQVKQALIDRMDDIVNDLLGE